MKAKIFTPYQAFVVAVMAILQFTVVLDFMVLSPLGAQLLKELHISTSQFGFVVSVYAFSAGLSGILAAGFADKFDRKKLLLFFYVGFVLGTLFCALAPTYKFLLAARMVTGFFGGVIGAVSFAIVADLFKLEIRGRVMGYIQMAFSFSQILGIPVGLFLANSWGWHSPFWVITALSVITGVIIFLYLKPINDHLKIKNENNPFKHLYKTLSNPNYVNTFVLTTLLTTGAFMLMPLGSTFMVNNLGVNIALLPLIYIITGGFSIFIGPLLGKLSDKIGKYALFTAASTLTMIIVVVYCNMSFIPLWTVVALNVIMFIGIMGRIISSSALTTAVPELTDRGAFMSITSSLQQVSGGIASILAGFIVFQTSSGLLKHYDILGYLVSAAIVGTIIMMHYVNRYVMQKNTAVLKNNVQENTFTEETISKVS